MVIEGDEVVPRLFGEHRQGYYLVGGRGGRIDEDAELEVVSVIAHVSHFASVV
jgi:hypothetical protein